MYVRNERHFSLWQANRLGTCRYAKLAIYFSKPFEMNDFELIVNVRGSENYKQERRMYDMAFLYSNIHVFMS